MVVHMKLQGSLLTVLFIGLATSFSNIQFQNLPSRPHSFSGNLSSLPFYCKFFIFYFLIILGSVETPSRASAANRLAKPLIGEDGRIYVCSQKNFFAFEKNGSIAWKVTLNYACNTNISPVHGGSRKASHLHAESLLFTKQWR